MGALGPGDLQLVFECLRGALSQNTVIQKQAESALRALEARPGFCSCLAVGGRQCVWVSAIIKTLHRLQAWVLVTAVPPKYCWLAGDYCQQGCGPQCPLAGCCALQEQYKQVLAVQATWVGCTCDCSRCLRLLVCTACMIYLTALLSSAHGRQGG